MADTHRIARLAKLKRVRAIEQIRAAETAAANTQRLGKLSELAARSQTLAQIYAAREGAQSGSTLGGLFDFRRELIELSRRTAGEAEQARTKAEQSQMALAAAKKRQEIVEERLLREKRASEERRTVLDAGLARSLNRRNQAPS